MLNESTINLLKTYFHNDPIILKLINIQNYDINILIVNLIDKIKKLEEFAKDNAKKSDETIPDLEFCSQDSSIYSL